MKFIKVRDVKTPSIGTPKSAGIDLYIPNDHPIISIGPRESALIPSGLKANVPENHAFIAFNKSGIATKKNLAVGACVVDEDYQGEIFIHVYNFGDTKIRLWPGEKIIQCVLIPVNYEDVEIVETEDQLWEGKYSERGEGGFGSTGLK